MGVASLLLQAPPPAVVAAAPPAVAASPLALRALLALPPLSLVTLAALAGAAWAHRVGLRSVLAGTQGSGGGRVTAMLGAGAAIGLLLGAAIGAVEVAQPLGGGTAPAAGASLAVALLYGGLAEEVLMRWGLMSALTLALARLLPHSRAAGMRRVNRSVVAVAVFVTSLVFAAAHLPALAAFVPAPTAADVLRVLGLNTAAGIVYGALAWRQALESAMAAHVATHLGRVAVHAAWV
ncbi:type II CAAX prenyl endopeptidase Rce1 family protein [Azohydromonas sediminis]|uniref:CPBP family glutamic-type intramembrane protease n=1 Tax=Azohydromonas sediminis TaxID=2259674 RepID=UPI0013C2AB48|nr:CPBP family glutamic-type intramembrane protease [Azohydromonas sediminis]